MLFAGRSGTNAHETRPKYVLRTRSYKYSRATNATRTNATSIRTTPSAPSKRPSLPSILHLTSGLNSSRAPPFQKHINTPRSSHCEVLHTTFALVRALKRILRSYDVFCCCEAFVLGVLKMSTPETICLHLRRAVFSELPKRSKMISMSSPAAMPLFSGFQKRVQPGLMSFCGGTGCIEFSKKDVGS
ncbi:hypothetical protein BU23DRAFT_231833 [Bimuria novae-zelandiae CBS 107.79]|uniref:Uncharacterized protein n=1 Tax=Bimuria novae-zelandiae CBS 107.79 TaxID=1447943 RepID=A0A6A5V9F0_9PLEO|nr:hypothetical protein BU23DRAFT_231833 [Bimuria novae-zelandiae CBS 107.79]